jgi:hypothetical protein
MITLGINYSQMHDSSVCLVRYRRCLLWRKSASALSTMPFPETGHSGLLGFAKIRWGGGRSVYGLGSGAISPRLQLYATGKWPISYLNVLNSTRLFAACGIRTVA